jgi:uncharacterized protein YjeT (DUF2065 family)
MRGENATARLCLKVGLRGYFMDIPSFALSVTTPLTLIAFLVGLAAYVHGKELGKRIELIGLPEEQRVRIVIEQIRASRDRFRMFGIVVCFAICAGVVLAYLLRPYG